MTLRITAAHVEAILEQSRAEYPDECCGVILGPEGSDSAQVLKPMVNAAHSPTFYEFDSKDLLALYREVDDNSQEIVVAALNNLMKLAQMEKQLLIIHFMMPSGQVSAKSFL